MAHLLIQTLNDVCLAAGGDVDRASSLAKSADFISPNATAAGRRIFGKIASEMNVYLTVVPSDAKSPFVCLVSSAVTAENLFARTSEELTASGVGFEPDRVQVVKGVHILSRVTPKSLEQVFVEDRFSAAQGPGSSLGLARLDAYPIASHPMVRDMCTRPSPPHPEILCKATP